VTLKWLTLSDLEVKFYAKRCFITDFTKFSASISETTTYVKTNEDNYFREPTAGDENFYQTL